MKSSDLNIVVLGAGAIGSTLSAWLHNVHDNVHILARKPALDALRRDGLTVYKKGDVPVTTHMNVIENLNDLPSVDIVILCVKNYSLAAAAKQIVEQIGNDVIIVAIQNGLKNRVVLPQYFRKVIFGIAQHNAWKEDITTFGYNRKKKMILEEPVFQDARNEILLSLFKKAMPTIVTGSYNDAAHNKLLANITNSLLSLGGKPQSEADLRALHFLFARISRETIQILETAGIKYFPLEGIPSWRLIKLMSRLPLFLSRSRFREGLKEVQVTSMQQDIMNNTGHSELDTINGYLLKLAERYDAYVPYSRALYNICRKEFQNKRYRPTSHAEVLKQIKESLNSHTKQCLAL